MRHAPRVRGAGGRHPVSGWRLGVPRGMAMPGLLRDRSCPLTRCRAVLEVLEAAYTAGVLSEAVAEVEAQASKVTIGGPRLCGLSPWRPAA